MNCRKEKEPIATSINKGNLDYNWKLFNENGRVLSLLPSSVVSDNERLSSDNSWFLRENELPDMYELNKKSLRAFAPL